MSNVRVGIGVDAHAFADGVPLVLGGVSFESPRGLAGHSDGDVITHALIEKHPLGFHLLTRGIVRPDQ